MCPGTVCGEESIIWMVSHSESPLHVRGYFIEQSRSDSLLVFLLGRKPELKLKHALGNSISALSLALHEENTEGHCKLGHCHHLGVHQRKHAFVFFLLPLPASPLNVYHPETCRWKRNSGIAASTIPVQGISGLCRKTICSLLWS